MIYPTLATLHAARARVPTELVPDSAWQRMLDVARLLPDAATTQYFEVRLAEGSTRVDYLVAGAQPAGAAALLAEGSGFDPSLDGDERWARIRSFFARWMADEGLRAFVPTAWMEFDLDGEQAVPVPQVGFCVDPGLHQGFDAGPAPSATSPAFQAPTEACLEELFGRPLSDAGRAALRLCASALPEGGRIIHLAAMIGRPGRELIRVVPELPVESVLGYLDALGSAAPRDAVVDALEALCLPRGGLVKIDVDVDEGIRPKFAVASEFSLDGDAGWERARALYGRLVERGLCSPARRDALLSWPGTDRELIEGYGWPATVHRLLDAKVVVHGDGRLEAKSYLGVNPRFVLFH